MPDSINNDISLADGRKITTEAATWKGTAYAMIGGNSAKGVSGDCSGSTHKIYAAAGFNYEFRNTSSFPEYATSSGLFRKLGADEQKQDGDILSWSGHMAIFCSFYLDSVNATTPRTNKSGTPYLQTNDMWTASHTGGPAYGPGKISWFKAGVMPDVYRYQKKN
jgi:hypothetical protein